MIFQEFHVYFFHSALQTDLMYKNKHTFEAIEGVDLSIRFNFCLILKIKIWFQYDT